jgi:hypothetical protein
LVLEEGVGHEKMLARKQRRREELKGNKSKKNTWALLKFYAPRLLGTGGAWLVSQLIN